MLKGLRPKGWQSVVLLNFGGYTDISTAGGIDRTLTRLFVTDVKHGKPVFLPFLEWVSKP